MSSYIEHDGIVIAQVSEDKYMVNIVQQSACATCKAASLCTVAESKEKSIEAFARGKEYVVGESVVVYGRTSLGYKALALAVILPLFIAMTTLLLVSHYIDNEALAGISALIMLIPYYIVLWLLRSRIKRVFVFYIKDKVYY